MKRTLLLPCACAVLACAPGAPPPQAGSLQPDSLQADSLRGVVDVVGSEPGTWVVMRMGAGARDVALAGDDRVLRRLQGLEVVVWGAPGEVGTFHVQRLAVRASGRVPAVDGVLQREGQGLVLLTEDGRRLPVVPLPEALRHQAGARVWIAGLPGGPPDSFGVIRPAGEAPAPR